MENPAHKNTNDCVGKPGPYKYNGGSMTVIFLPNFSTEVQHDSVGKPGP